MMQLSSLKQIRDILRDCSTIAVVGLSPKPVRPSHQVALYMLREGYRVIPVNPGHDSILGLTCHPDLLAVPERIDIVNIFRRSEQVLPIVRDAVTREARVIWMQEGIVNREAAELAAGRGMTVIMDRCIMVDHQQLFSRFDEA